MHRRTIVLGGVSFALALLAAATFRFGRPLWSRARVKMFGGRTIQDVVAKYGADARTRLASGFAAASVAYPPDRVTLLAFKREKRLEVWASDGADWRLVHLYPVCAASGVEGPKLREGDLQVPEGVYALTVLNPNSGFHLSIRVDYPNEFDRDMAARDGRTDPGGDIYIHGNCVSIGCLAMGDEAIEELFILAHDVGLINMEIVIAPTDLRDPSVAVSTSGMPPWTPQLYDSIRAKLASFRSKDGLR